MDKLKFEQISYASFYPLLYKEGSKWIAQKEQPDLVKQPCLNSNLPPHLIDIRLHERFVDLIESWRHPSGHYYVMVQGYILGKDGDVLTDAEHIDADNEGCLSFPTFQNPTFMKAYTAIAKRSEPCGLARVSSVSCTSFWSHSSSGVYWDKTGYSLNKESYYLNYHPSGIEALRGDITLRNYRILNFRKKKQISVPELFEAECVDTLVQS